MTSEDGFLHRYGFTVEEAVESLYPAALVLANDDLAHTNDLLGGLFAELVRRPAEEDPVPDGEAALLLELTRFVIDRQPPDLWRQVVDAVGADDAEILRLYFVERLTAEEIGRRLGAQESDVEARVRRIVATLHRHLDEGTT